MNKTIILTIKLCIALVCSWSTDTKWLVSCLYDHRLICSLPVYGVKSESLIVINESYLCVVNLHSKHWWPFRCFSPSPWPCPRIWSHCLSPRTPSPWQQHWYVLPQCNLNVFKHSFIDWCLFTLWCCSIVVLNCYINCHCTVMFMHVRCISFNKVSVVVSWVECCGVRQYLEITPQLFSVRYKCALSFIVLLLLMIQWQQTIDVVSYWPLSHLLLKYLQ